MLKALSQAQIDRIAADGRRLLQKDRGETKVLNLQNALALGQPLPLEYRGEVYTVKALSYRDGVALQIAERNLHTWATSPPQSVDELEDQDAAIIEMLVTFHSFLDPKPEENPFMEASPLEVGELLRFFCLCLMMQNAPSAAGSRFPMSTRLTN